MALHILKIDKSIEIHIRNYTYSDLVYSPLRQSYSINVSPSSTITSFFNSFYSFIFWLSYLVRYFKYNSLYSCIIKSKLNCLLYLMSRLSGLNGLADVADNRSSIQKAKRWSLHQSPRHVRDRMDQPLVWSGRGEG